MIAHPRVSAALDMADQEIRVQEFGDLSIDPEGRELDRVGRCPVPRVKRHRD